MRKVVTKYHTIENHAWSNGFWYFMALCVLLAVVLAVTYMVFLKAEELADHGWKWLLTQATLAGKAGQIQFATKTAHVALEPVELVHVTPMGMPMTKQEHTPVDTPLPMNGTQQPVAELEFISQGLEQQTLVESKQIHLEIIHPELILPEPIKPEPVKPEPIKPEQIKPELIKPEQIKPEPIKPEPVKPEPVKPEPVKPEPVKPEPVKPEPVKPEPVKPEPVKPEPVKPEPVKPEPVKPEPVKPEPVKPEPVKPEPVKPEPVKPEPVKPEPVKPEPNQVVYAPSEWTTFSEFEGFEFE